MSAALHRGLALGALLSLGCARPAIKIDHRQWPPAPSPARVVYQGGFPDERAVASPSFWTRAFEAIFGIDERARRAREQSILVRPFGLAVQGPLLYVADPDGRQVLAVKWREGTYEAVTCKFAWHTPMAVAAPPDGVVYVADSGLRQVVRIERGECSAFGEGLMRPVGLAVGGGRVFVVDALLHGVVSYDLSGGRERGRFGDRGEGNGELNFPTAIAIRNDGALQVVDSLNFRVVTFSPQGEVLGAFGRGGGEQGDFARPKAVAVDRQGRVYVSDAQYGVVLIFDPEGQWQLAFGGSGREPKNFSLPAGVAVFENMLFVADAYHHRVEFFELREVPP